MAEEEKIGADNTSENPKDLEKKTEVENTDNSSQKVKEEESAEAVEVQPESESAPEEVRVGSDSNESVDKVAPVEEPEEQELEVSEEKEEPSAIEEKPKEAVEFAAVHDQKLSTEGENTDNSSQQVEEEESPEAVEVQPKSESMPEEVRDESDSNENVDEIAPVREPKEQEPEVLKEKEEPANTEEKPQKEVELTAAVDENKPELEADTKVAKKELHSEEDLSEKDAEDEDEDEEEVDYSEFSKEQLVDTIKSLAKDDNIIKSDRIAREIKPLFDEIRDKERNEALEKFLADGGEEKDFDFKFDELANRFDANYKLIHDRKVQYIKDREQQKENNLKKKEDILERLREFVDSDDPNISFNDFKEYQNEWKAVGPVPQAYARTLWANYNALVDRFYDHRNIYFELKELDRKKNLELKLVLCEKAEELSKHDNVPEAIKALNELHHEFKHIGPVPKDDQEPLWQRFKAASDAVYDNRKGFVEELKKELDQNLVVKEELAEQAQAFISFDTDRIKEWNSKTKELLDLQKKWEAIGGLPRAKAKEINKKFWGAFKTFFHHKGAFFKKLDGERETNLEKKRELVGKAEELKESTDWNKTAEAYKKLQKSWREIGPVPEKFRESVYQEFKKACDYFFDQRRSNQNEAEKEYVANYTEKMKICEELIALAKKKSGSLEQLEELQNKFDNIGFVPRKSISETKKKYAEAVDSYIGSLENISEDDKQRLKIQGEINKISGGPNAGQRIFRKEQGLRNQISKIESDISVWKNNMEFFASSSTADKLKVEFQEKIDSANIELTRLKNELRILRSVT